MADWDAEFAHLSGPRAPAVWNGEVIVETNDGVEYYFMKMYVEGCLVMVPTSKHSLIALGLTCQRAGQLGSDFDAGETHHMWRGGQLNVSIGDDFEIGIVC